MLAPTITQSEEIEKRIRKAYASVVAVRKRNLMVSSIYDGRPLASSGLKTNPFSVLIAVHNREKASRRTDKTLQMAESTPHRNVEEYVREGLASS